MLNRLRKRLSYANVIASLALFIALGGVGYAATIAAKNSVRSSSIKNGQVKSVDIANNAVTSSKIKNGGVGNRDLAPGAVNATKLSAALKSDLDDAGTVGGLSPAQIVAAAGGLYSEARQAAGSVDIEKLTDTDLVTLDLPAAGKYLITARMPFTCTYDGSDGPAPGNPLPLGPYFVGKAKLLVGGAVVDTLSQTCEAESAIAVVLAGVYFGTSTVEFTRQITVTGPTQVKLRGLAETSIVFFFTIPAGARITAAASGSVIQAVTVHTS